MIARDLRYAVRSLRRTPLFTAAAVLSLAVGIATSGTVFSLVDAAILRPPPFPDANRLAVLNITQHTPAEGQQRLRWSWPRFLLLRQDVRSFDGVASSSNNVVTLTGVEDPEPLAVEIVSSGYLRVMGAPLLLGHGFTPNEDDPGRASPLVILSHDLWQRRFAGADDVVGRVLELNSVPLTVAGVAAPGFAGVSGLARAWIPTALAPRVTYRDYLTTNQNFITVIGRLRRGVTLDAARAELQVVGQRIDLALPSERDTPQDRFSATLLTLNDARIDVVTRRALRLLAGAVAILQLIVCANVASLLLGRAAGRRQEIAIRLAVGAGRRRLVQQLLVESGLLAAVSSVVGLAIAAWIIAAVRIPPTLARGRNFYGAVGEFAMPALDWRVVAFTVALAACTVLLFGLTPALRATRMDLVGDLKDGGARTSESRRRVALREVIVAFQVALAVVLTVGCGLLITSHARLRETPLGFDPSRLLTFAIRPSEIKYSVSSAPALLDRILEEIGRVPGVEAATVDGCTPLSMQCANGSLHILGRPWQTGTDPPIVQRHYVARDHFKTLEIPVLRGRGFTERDRAGQPPVVVINEAAAQRFWPGGDPLGQRIWFEGSPTIGDPDSTAEIVGIVRNVAYRPLDEEPFQPDFFTPYAQFTYASRVMLVRTHGEPLELVPQVARAVRRADPSLALFDVRTMDARARESWSKHTFLTRLFMMIGAIALALAVTGVFAVTSYAVASRVHEIGVRIALGASSLDVARASMARTVRLALAGGMLGLVGGLGLGRIMSAVLYQTSPFDGRVFLGAAVVLGVAVVAATYVPLRRALHLNPVDVLRNY